MKDSADDKRDFVRAVWRHYKERGRDFPWRRTRNPYRILVSEIMLQQTQTARVVGKYREFLRAFPTVEALAAADTRSLLSVWRGLGYNRRVLMLRQAAVIVARRHGGRVPQDRESLLLLPGVGPATACAVRAFAYNEPVVFIETNIRSAYLDWFFPGTNNVRDADLVPLVSATLPRGRVRQWYSALMDYGADLKKKRGNPSRRSAHHVRQKPFDGSNRQLRGRILSALLDSGPAGPRQIARRLEVVTAEVEKNLYKMEQEGFVQKRKTRFHICS